MSNLDPKLAQLLADVPLHSHPKVVFPYGFRVAEIDGEKVLIPLTPAEKRELIIKNGGVELTDEMLLGDCWLKVSGCHDVGCQEEWGGRCQYRSETPGAAYCTCAGAKTPLAAV